MPGRHHHNSPEYIAAALSLFLHTSCSLCTSYLKTPPPPSSSVDMAGEVLSRRQYLLDLCSVVSHGPTWRRVLIRSGHSLRRISLSGVRSAGGRLSPPSLARYFWSAIEENPSCAGEREVFQANARDFVRNGHGVAYQSMVGPNSQIAVHLCRMCSVPAVSHDIFLERGKHLPNNYPPHVAHKLIVQQVQYRSRLLVSTRYPILMCTDSSR